MGFCDNCKTCGFFYDTSRNDLCPKCVVMAAEKDTSKVCESPGCDKPGEWSLTYHTVQGLVTEPKQYKSEHMGNFCKQHGVGETTQTDNYPVHDAAQSAATEYYGYEPKGAVSDFANGFLRGVVWKEQVAPTGSEECQGDCGKPACLARAEAAPAVHQEEVRRTLMRIIATAGSPDAAEGCRNIIKHAKALLDSLATTRPAQQDTQLKRYREALEKIVELMGGSKPYDELFGDATEIAENVLKGGGNG